MAVDAKLPLPGQRLAAGRFHGRLAVKGSELTHFSWSATVSRGGSVTATWHDWTRWKDFTPPGLRRLLRLVSDTAALRG